MTHTPRPFTPNESLVTYADAGGLQFIVRHCDVKGGPDNWVVTAEEVTAGGKRAARVTALAREFKKWEP